MENKICMLKKRVSVSGSILYHLSGDRLWTAHSLKLLYMINLKY